MVEHPVLLRLFLLVVFWLDRGICQEPYAIGFHEGFSDCDDFENGFFKAENMDLGKLCGDGGEDSMYLEGYLEFCESIKQGTFIEVKVEKETELGSEPMWSCSRDLCESLEDKDAPWAEAVKMMNMTGCPVEKAKYYCEKFFLDMTFATDYLNRNWEGGYSATIKLSDGHGNTLSCHQLGMAIFPEKDRK